MSSTSSAILSLTIYKEEHETFGFGLSNALSAVEEGCYVCAVGRESPAERAGLQKYDRVIQVSENNIPTVK